MARAEAAHASTRSDSIKGLAQSIANPAYRRLLVAEPALRRAVPLLIVAFLITVGVGAVVQVYERYREAIAAGLADIETLADIVVDRLERVSASGTADDLLAAVLPARAASANRIVLLLDHSGAVVAASTNLEPGFVRSLSFLIGQLRSDPART